jgi:hypothetical protein
MRNGKPKPPTVTGVFLFAKTMARVIETKTCRFFMMHDSIFDGWDSPGGAHHPLTIAVYAFICCNHGVVDTRKIKKAFKHEKAEAIDNALYALEVYKLITIVNR